MTWRKREIMEMAREAGICTWLKPPADVVERIEAFAELVREEATAEANARANASWTLMCEKMVAIEREACAKVCETSVWSRDVRWWQSATKSDVSVEAALQCAAAIRARSNT